MITFTETELLTYTIVVVLLAWIVGLALFALACVVMRLRNPFRKDKPLYYEPSRRYSNP